MTGTCLIDGHELSISASIGIALHPFGSQMAADVLKQADTAMYRAKQGGRNALHFFACARHGALRVSATSLAVVASLVTWR